MRRLAIFTLVLTTAGLALVLSSCSSPISPLSTASVPGIIGLQQSSNTQLLDMLAPSSSYAPMALSPQQLTKAGLQPQSFACVQSSNWSTATNADNDLAPKSATITYGNCTGITSITASGTFTIADTNDNDAYSGFNAALNGFTMTASTVTLSMNGSLDVLRTSTPPTYNYAINYQLAINITTPSVSGSVNVSGTPTFTSTLSGPPAPPYGPYGTGAFTLNGTAAFDTSNGIHYSLTRTGTGVVDTSTCLGSFATNSHITYTDSQGNTLVLAYTGCGTGNWTLTASGGGSSTGTF